MVGLFEQGEDNKITVGHFEHMVYAKSRYIIQKDKEQETLSFKPCWMESQCLHVPSNSTSSNASTLSFKKPLITSTITHSCNCR